MVDWACERCGTSNSPQMGVCARCGALKHAAPSGAERDLAIAGGPSVSAPSFEPVLPLGVGDLGLGLLAGVIAAAIATAVWYGVVVLTGWQVGVVAIVVGLLVGAGVVFGAGGRGSLPLVAASFLLTLCALAASEYLIVYHFVSEYFGPGVVDVIQPPDLVLEIVVDSLQSDPATLLFWGIALFQAVAIPFRAMR